MKVIIHHKTSYCYEASTRRSIQMLRMTPLSMQRQKVLNWMLTLPAFGSESYDGLGNFCTLVSLNFPHQELQIEAQGEVEINTDIEAILDQRIPIGLFLRKTPLTECSDQMIEFAAPFLSSGNQANLHHRLIDFSHALLQRVKYIPGVTHVASSAQDAFQLGSGVCQDHTHLFLACARHFGIPTRYVSGYLHSETQEHSESHAWAEAYLDGHWYVFDVSNLLFSPSQHVQIAIGLDYNDTAPIRGVRVGGGAEKMNYAVRIMNEQQQQARC
ncbi:MAG TPA: transglutaminase family protein [Pasteurellaceae bacterium]|nr:transglutaminase family protein [Pasteurellaceae bacterium]